MEADSVAALTRRVRVFSQARDWERFHTPKNLAMALIAEAAELVEHYQWLTPEESRTRTDDDERREAIASEVADVAIYLLRFADVVGIDVGTAVLEKLAVNEGRFPPTADGTGSAPPEVAST